MSFQIPQTDNEADVQAFCRQFRELFLPLSLYLTKQNRDDAESIVADVLLNILKNPEEWRKYENLHAASYSAIKNKFSDYYRCSKKIRNETFIEGSPFKEILEKMSNDEDTLRDLKEWKEEVSIYVDTLNSTLQTVYQLYFVDGCSHAEMAKRRSISTEHSRQDLSRLLKILRKKFN